MKYKKIVEHELERFLDNKNMTIEQFCINVNKKRMKLGLQPVGGTPFEKDGYIYTLEKKSVPVMSIRKS